jgi:signal peptidase II
MTQVRRQIGMAAGVAALLIALDQITKKWAVHSLTEGVRRHVFSTLHFQLHFNSGMAFSRGQGMGRIIGVLAVAVSVVLFASLRRARRPLAVIAVGLVAGGAVGNVLDRLFRSKGGFLNGSVVDFIDLRFWPIFNIADSGVVVGAALLIVDSWRHDRERSKLAAPAESTPNATPNATFETTSDADASQ